MPLNDNQAPTPLFPDTGPTPIENFGKGAVQESQESQDSHYALAFSAQPPIDWSVPYRVAASLTQRNQKTSSSCTAQATMYYTEALNQIEHGVSELYSARHNYSQATIGYGQGAYIWKAMSFPLTQGAASANSVPDGDSTELTMTDKSDNWKAVLEAKTDKYAVISRQGQGIDFLANIIKDYHGFITGFNGWNGMFAADGTVVDWSKNEWGHAVYVCGYEMHNGVKCLVFKNSWSDTWGSGGFGYFPEAFVTSGMMYDAYVYSEIADLDPNSVMLTEKQVRALQALEGYKDEAGVIFWTGKLLSDYLAARLPDKIKTLTEAI